MAENQEDWDEWEDDEMPVPCQKCGKIFDLSTGTGSEKWFPDTVICETCGRDEKREIDRDEEIEMIREQFAEADYMLKDCAQRLEKLGMTREQLNEI